MQKVIITDKSTLEDAIRLSGLEDYFWLVNPQMRVEPSASLEEQQHWKSVLKGRTFEKLSLQEICVLFPDWNLPSIIEGLNYLLECAAKRELVYDFSSKEKDVALMAFTMPRTSKFVIICPGSVK